MTLDYERDLMITSLRRAVGLGYNMDSPGSGRFGDAVRDAFPDQFATAEEIACVATNDDLTIDDYPMVQVRAEGGIWLQTWSWVPVPSRQIRK